jgi:hypothetical protein
MFLFCDDTCPFLRDYVKEDIFHFSKQTGLVSFIRVLALLVAFQLVADRCCVLKSTGAVESLAREHTNSVHTKNALNSLPKATSQPP